MCVSQVCKGQIIYVKELKVYPNENFEIVSMIIPWYINKKAIPEENLEIK